MTPEPGRNCPVRRASRARQAKMIRMVRQAWRTRSPTAPQSRATPRSTAPTAIAASGTSKAVPPGSRCTRAAAEPIATRRTPTRVSLVAEKMLAPGLSWKRDRGRPARRSGGEQRGGRSRYTSLMTTFRSRATGLGSMLDEFFGTYGLEGDPIPETPDAGFPLRPFAAAVPQDDLVATEPSTDESPGDRLYRRAVEAATRGRVAEAIQRYRELLTLEPGHVAARNNLSALLETTGDPAEALEQLTQALRVAPDDVNMLVSRGAIHGRLKQYGDAEIDLKRALRLDPQHVQAYLTLGLVLWRKGVPKEAAETLRKGLWLEPDNALAHYYLGEALNQAGDLKGARAALEKSAELAPDHGRTFRLLARVLDRMGRYEEAQAMYRRAREVGEA